MIILKSFVKYVLIVFVFTCLSCGASFASPTCMTREERIDWIQKVWCANPLYCSCNVAGDYYDESGIHYHTLEIHRTDKYVDKDGNQVCSGVFKNTVPYCIICSDNSNPCCGSVDQYCGKTDPTAGNPHGDKSLPHKDPGKMLDRCEPADEMSEGASAGKP